MDKTLGIQDYLEIGLRRKWFFIIPFVVVAMMTVAYAKWAPKIYQASTLILVEQPELPAEYVRSTVTERTDGRLLTVQQQITSRSFLGVIVEEFDLLAEPKMNLSLESVIQSLRKRITVEVTGEQAIRISFENRSPEMTMKIANRLTTLFIERSLRQREEQALGTISFLDRELERVQKLMKQQERKVSEFRTRYFSMLPEDLPPGGRAFAPADITESDDLIVLYSLLRRLQLKYTDEHPEIIRLKARIAEAERSKNKMRGTATLEAQASPTAAEVTQLNRLQLQQQLSELTRDNEVTQREYQSLLDKKLQAELAAGMEKKQKGQRFQVLDQAAIPEFPIKPKPEQVLLVGLLCAIAAGVGLVTVTERFDTSFYKIEDLEEFTELPVIANISKMTGKRTFNTMLEKFTKSPAIANISKIMKKFSSMLEVLTKSILTVIASISKKNKKGRN